MNIQFPEGTLLREIIDNRHLIWKLAKNDLKTRFAGSYLGVAWAFVHPVVTVLIYWLVFGKGLKSGQALGIPFLVYLVCGIVPWFYCQEFVSVGTLTLLEYSYLVKKVVFNIRVLPVVKALSSLFVHLFFVLVALVIAALYGYYPTVYLIQIPYYCFAMLVFILGIVYATCSITVFFRDMAQVVGICLQFGIWSVPIMFDISSFQHLGWLFRINPMYYIVTGYRDAIYGRVWFFERGFENLYFWAWAVFAFVLGNAVFRRLRVHFADVL
ncbi:MAG: ABC transporter permease [Lachnospiraceae bacterium]|nr:ABC transporter permease [Lachnospiraceae bacterium]